MSYTLRFDSEWSPRPHFRVLYRALHALDVKIIQRLELTNTSPDPDPSEQEIRFLAPIQMPSLSDSWENKFEAPLTLAGRSGHPPLERPHRRQLLWAEADG